VVRLRVDNAIAVVEMDAGAGASEGAAVLGCLKWSMMRLGVCGGSRTVSKVG
jgi:hypothetical protein